MRFEKGHWQLLPGVQTTYPVSVTDVHSEPDALVVTGYNHQIQTRSDFIGGSIITARFTSPLPNVIRVQLNHFRGQVSERPLFDLDYSIKNENVSITADTSSGCLVSGNLKVIASQEKGWGFEFIRGEEVITASGEKAIALLVKDGMTYIRESLCLSPGEMVFGLGERFGPFVKNGQSIDIWNEDGGTDSEYSYKNIPFYITSKGYGILVNNPGPVSFEIGSHHTTRVQFSVPNHSLEYYLFGGPTPKDVLEQMTTVCGRPARLPEWSFGLWLSTSFTTDYDENRIISTIERMNAEGIPVNVFHFDCFWMKELTWCSFLWDKRYFPDPAAMLQKIKSLGARVSLWINPYVAEASPLFNEGAENGYFIHAKDGSVYQIDDWQPGIAFVDFTNPSAREWYTGKLKTLMDMGVDTFKTDFGERIPTQVSYYDGSDPMRMHNYYSYLYNQTVFDVLRSEKGDGNAVLFARSATCGGQKYPLHWGGDNSSSYPSMAETLRGGLSLGMCGYGYWSHDIGGFNDTATADLYKRWVAFGLLSSHSRLHGNSSPKVPWTYDAQAVEVLRYFTSLKSRLMPYLLDVAREACEHGWPMMRAMVLEYPDDRTCLPLDMQYMLGPALLIAPVMDPSGKVEYYLPGGEWQHLLSGEVVHGPLWRQDVCDYFTPPIWVRLQKASKWSCLIYQTIPS